MDVNNVRAHLESNSIETLLCVVSIISIVKIGWESFSLSDLLVYLMHYLLATLVNNVLKMTANESRFDVLHF